MSNFAKDIRKFNGMYKMKVSETPTLDVGVPLVKRLTDFKSIVTKELSEIDDIIMKASKLSDASSDADRLDIMTDLTDLLGDIQVYCASEMAKFGLPLDETLSIIMASNFSKMGADGKPIYDGEGKLQKGENYYKPEPELSAMLLDRMVTPSAVDSTVVEAA